MSSSLAWQLHGCYTVGSVKYANFPIDSARYGCLDDNVSLDHRDPSHALRNIIKRMFEMRKQYPVLNDGWYLQQLSKQTYNVYLPGSKNMPTETGLWSIYRSAFSGVQNISNDAQGDQSVWLLYTNENKTVDYSISCSSNRSIVSPFTDGTVVKNLFAPYEEYTLETSFQSLGLEGTTEPNGCISNMTMPAWGFKAFVPKDKFVDPKPTITSFSPGHDMRLYSDSNTGQTVSIGLGFSTEMDCLSIMNSVHVTSTTVSGGPAILDNSTMSCSAIDGKPEGWIGEPQTNFRFSAELQKVHHGVHRITVNNASSSAGSFTNAVDHFMLRLGSFENPMVYPTHANYSSTLLHQTPDNALYVSHKADGADLWRYSLNFGSTYSDWMPYTGGNSSLDEQPWSGTSKQEWKGHHAIIQYWSRLAGSSDHYQHGDTGVDATPRRLPNLFLEGPFNQFGHDAGLNNEMQLQSDSTWRLDFMSEWPVSVSLNAWGINPDGKLDATQVWGDVDGGKLHIPRSWFSQGPDFCR